MQFTCRYTGLRLTLQGFDSVTASFAHPLCQLDTLHLNRIAARKLASGEEKLLAVAYLAQFPCIHWERPCQFDKITHVQIMSWLPVITRLANWLHRAPVKLLEQLPHYRVTAESANLANFGHYLEALESFREWGNFFTKDSSKTSWETSAEIKEARQAILQRKAAQAQNFEAIIVWACNWLQTTVETFGPHSYKMLSNILRGKDAVLSILKEAKATCLDFLPEDTTDDYLKKNAVIQKIDTAILKKIQFLQTVGVDISKEEETLTSIQASYTIEIGDKEFLNSAAAPVAHLKSIMAGDSATTWADQNKLTVPTPTAEPKREDYPNAILFAIAARKWKDSQAQH